MSDLLTQEQIDALLNGDSTEEETKSVSNTNEVSNFTDAIDPYDQYSIDIIGEVGNISMSQAATTLSQLLNHQVKITTPQVSVMSIKEILEHSEFPKVVTSIDFKSGLDGSNMLMIDIPDAIIIADLMMGNDGTNVGEEFTDLELSAVGEAMNQMIGSSTTAMAQMIDRRIDILPPNVELIGMNGEEKSFDEKSEEPIFAIAFEMTVEGLINSQIMQLFSYHTVQDICEAMMNDKAVTLRDRKVVDSVKEEATPTPAAEEPKVEVQKAVFQELSESNTGEMPKNLDLIMDVPLEFTVMLGQSKKSIRDILSLGTGSVVELDKMTDEPLEILVNGKLVAEGEVVVINESFGIRITNILSKEERVRNLN